MAALSVLELPSKRLLNIPLPSEEGGDMITMERFVSILRGNISKPAIKHLMVGDRCIETNRDRLNKDRLRSVRFFLLDNSPWYVHTWEPKLIFVRIPTGKVASVDVEACENVLDVKKFISQCEGIPVDEQRLIGKGRMLQDCESILPNQTIDLVLRLRGGGCGPALGVPFADVTDEAGPVMHEWSREAPPWREAAPGMCLEGECTNQDCEAHMEMVVVEQGYCEFDYLNDAHMCKCPMCEQPIVPSTCGFNNCRWKFITRKISTLGQPPQVVHSEWKSVGDVYARYSPEENGTGYFLDLKILCKEKTREVCAVCTRQMNSSRKRARCGHSFHRKCFDFATSDRNCIECMSKHNMTRHQKTFS